MKQVVKLYIPPQDYPTILHLMDNLVDFVNDDTVSELDPLIKMALFHFQFETIHPFYDGNVAYRVFLIFCI